ncbi:MAG: hypothetical protein H7210_09890 [Pyrinomonadaceae bacterium]|nr:hypothetical protein [Phycisphaerales bacterium]
MHNVLPILGTIAGLLSILITLVLAAGMKMFTMRAPSGPDAMGLAMYFFVQIAGWVFLLLAAFMGLGRGSFDWISSAGGIPTLLVSFTTVGLATLAVFSAGASLDMNFRWRTPAGLAGALVMPLFVELFVLVLLWLPLDFLEEATWPRVVGWVLAGMACAVYIGAGVAWYHAMEARGRREIAREEERQADQQRYEEEARQQELVDDAQLDAMPDDAPLEEFLSHLFIDKSKAHNARAIKRIDNLPNLVARVEERLSHPLPIQREYCANYIRHSEKPDPGFIPALKKSTLQLAADYRLGAQDPARSAITHVKGLTWGTLLTIQRFPSGTFQNEVAELRAAVSLWAESEDRNTAIEFLDRYLRGEPVPL